MSDKTRIFLKWLAAIPVFFLTAHTVGIYLRNRAADSAAIEEWEIRMASMPPPQKPISETSTELGTISTVMHDGHKFVMTSSYKGRQMLHHPACGCEVKP